jgi:predicted Rossmann fold flavoprotein
VAFHDNTVSMERHGGRSLQVILPQLFRMTHWDVIIVGGGPAGLMAAATTAQRGRKILLLEKNRGPGVKILLSGGTRCNLTHATDSRGIVEAFGPAGRFLHSALAALSPGQLVDLFAAEGVATKVEEGGKVFPQSDRAADVLDALLRRLHRSGCEVACEEPVAEIERFEGGFRMKTSQRTLTAERIILTTGGRSYPQCGTTGDGYRWAAALGHTIVEPCTALVPVTTHATWVKSLQGITVPDVFVRVVENRNAAQPPSAVPADIAQPRAAVLHQRRGSFLFTHFGLSGPAVLDVSRAISACANPQALELHCDFLPAMEADELETFMVRQTAESGKKHIAGILGQLIPRRLAETLAQLAAIVPSDRAAEFAKEDRERLVQAVKQTVIPVAGTLGFRKAEVTAGGVSLREIDSRTMQSKLVPNLYFAGELLDVDGPIGGYNFQAAFSTGALAGECAAEM